MPTPPEPVDLIFIAHQPGEIPEYQNAALGNIRVSVRPFEHDKDHASTLQLDADGTPYFWTAASSDFINIGEALYQTTAHVAEMLARPACQGVYMHEVATHLASINAWNWTTAVNALDWAWIDTVMAAAKLAGKRVLWSEPAQGWPEMLVNATAIANLTDYDPLTVVPMFATNFSPRTLVDDAQAGAEAVAAQHGFALGMSHQVWWWLDGGLTITTDESQALMERGYNAGARVFAVEGPDPYMTWGGTYLSGVYNFVQHIAHQPTPAVSGLPRVFLHDGAGRRIGQVVTARSIDRSYLLMEPASARFLMADDDPLVEQIDPRQGRFVVIESEQFPYPWVGKITSPDWDRNQREITVICRSADAILTQRHVGSTYSGSAGTVFKRMVEDAGAVNATGIAPAASVSSGPRYEAVVQDRSAFQALNGLAAATGHEWWVEYAVSETEIAAYAHFRPARGFDRCRGAYLNDGGNAEWTNCKIDGEAATFALTVVGGASSVTQAYAERPRAREVATGVASVHGHGIRRQTSNSSPLTRIERVQLSESLKASDLVQEAARALLSRPPIPEQQIVWRVLARNKRDRTPVDWSVFDLGSIVRAKAPTAFATGFDGDVRITAVQPHEEAGVLNLVVEIVEACDEA
jgi:hypothetical protein